MIDTAHELVTFLNWRTPFAWLVVTGLAASILLIRRRGLKPVWALWLWAAIVIAFLFYHHPLHDNHLLVLAAGHVQQQGRVALGEMPEQAEFRARRRGSAPRNQARRPRRL